MAKQLKIWKHTWLRRHRKCGKKSDRQGQNAPKGYIAQQEMTPEIAHKHVGRLQIK